MKARGKHALADIIYYFKMTSVMALDGVTLFLCLKEVIQRHIDVCDTVLILVGILQYNGGKLEEAEDFKCVFVIYCVLESKWIISCMSIVEY